MRENDDDAPASEPQGSLADGLGETMEREHETSGDPYGDVDFDDTYDEDTDTTSDSDGTFGDDASDDGTSGDDTYDTDGSYGDGDGDGAGADDTFGDDEPAEGDDTTTEGGFGDDEAFAAQDGSPLEGIGFLIDEVRDALFGEDDAAAASPFDTDPVDLETGTDLDLTGDGLVDRADLHEAADSLDFHVGDGHHGHGGHHDDGVMDA